MFPLAAVHAVNRRMEELLGLPDPVFAGICIAPEAPGEPSSYRKPSPRFIEEMCARDGLAKSKSCMIGDSPSDWEAGWRAGVNVGAVGVAPSAEGADWETLHRSPVGREEPSGFIARDPSFRLATAPLRRVYGTSGFPVGERP
jgi:beta-phosphoglucomutase-like phosphatase (HAD superfamily)